MINAAWLAINFVLGKMPMDYILKVMCMKLLIIKAQRLLNLAILGHANQTFGLCVELILIVLV